MIQTKYKSDNSTVIIIGANSAIGIALSLKLLEIGVKVFGIDIQARSQLDSDVALNYFQAQAQNENELLLLADVVNDSSEPIIGLVNLAGAMTSFDKITDLSTDAWEDTYNISFKSCHNACKIFSNKITAEGAIVNMSSGLAFLGQKGYGPYAAAKAAIISLTKTLAAELAPKIRVNSVAPGAVDTPFIRNNQGETRFPVEQYEQMTPQGRMAKPEEIADVILYLLSDGSSHITGQCIHVNGGSMMI